MIKIINFVSYCCILFCCVPLAFSQSNMQIKGDSVIYTYQLEEIVVYGERAANAPSMITELNAKDIQAKNAVTAADLLRSDPGLTLTSGSKAETETKIRGFQGRQVLVLLDGRPLNPGYYGKVDISMLPVDNIAKMKVIKGPASVAYGANSMGGVINIVTKNGLEKPRTTLDAQFGDYHFRKLSINHSNKIGQFNYWASGYENYSNGFKLSGDFKRTSLEDGGLRNNSFYHKAGGNLKIGWQSSKKYLYSLSVGYHWAKKDIPSHISPNYAKYRDFPYWKRFGGALSAQWKLSSDSELKSILFIDSYDDRLIDYNNRQRRDDDINFDSILKNRTIGGSIEEKIRLFDKHKLHAGLNCRQDLMNKKPDIQEPWYSHYAFTGSVFLQDSYVPWPQTEILVGINYNLSVTDEKNSSAKKLCPMLSIRQELPWKLQFHAAYSNAIRFPTLRRLYSEDSGNPDLKAEQADKIEIGLERMFLFNNSSRYVNVEAVYFYNDIKNLIYRGTSTDKFINRDEALMHGCEIRASWGFNRYLTGDISYGFIELIRSSDDLSFEIMNEVPENKARLYLSVKTDFGGEVNYEFNYFDKRATEYKTIVLPDYFLHNLNISQQIGERLKCRLKISNITDSSYQDAWGYPAPGRQFMGGFTLTI